MTVRNDECLWSVWEGASFLSILPSCFANWLQLQQRLKYCQMILCGSFWYEMNHIRMKMLFKISLFVTEVP